MLTPNQQYIYNWPGWELTLNEHGNEFDALARDRMVSGGLELTKYIYKYLLDTDNSILEVGPFFNPITKEVGSINGKFVTYWENDIHAIQWLKSQKFLFDFTVEECDLNNIDRDKNSKVVNLFNVVIVSQVFNYINYSHFLKLIRDRIHRNGLIFINNVVDYGLPKFFSDERPKSIEETVSLIKMLGFEVIEYEVIPSENIEFQKHDRLLLAGKVK
ncbi:hypothetical protein [Chamaesiphon sp.]|uniref:hypothetical protein n=1 Tax=Chamaesiphon sp. TaxID=2814140 RepID=UPI0035943C43